MRQPPSSSAEQTRTALVHAALSLFGAKGFDGTSTREIATRANANIGSIAYHFGGKDGLRTAVADYIVKTIGDIAGAALGRLDASEGRPLDRQAARTQLSDVLEAMMGFILTRPEAGEIVPFILRELSKPTAALDRIYDGVFEPTHRRLCAIWEAATGEPAESDETKLVIFTLIGQVVYFRIGREAIMRRMGWSAIGPAEASGALEIVRSNLDAILNARGGEAP